MRQPAAENEGADTLDCQEGDARSGEGEKGANNGPPDGTEPAGKKVGRKTENSGAEVWFSCQGGGADHFQRGML